MAVTRDSSADAMAAALSSAPPAPAQPRLEPTPEATRRLWAQREDIRMLAEAALRVGKLHADQLRLPFREREMARSVQRRCITLLAHLDDIDRLAASGRVSTDATLSGSGSDG